MKLSTRSRYGIHAMYDLAVNYRNGPQSIKAISERQCIPDAYLEQLVAPLKRDKLVKSVRGAQGGYTLSRPPEDITVGEIMRSLEGGLALMDCLIEEDACGKSCTCPSRIVWRRLKDGLNSILDDISLGDMLNENGTDEPCEDQTFRQKAIRRN